MTKASNLGSLSQSLQSRQMVIQDTVKEQIANELLLLKQTISDCVTSEVSLYLSDLNQGLTSQSSEELIKITELQNSIIERINSLIDFQPLTKAMGGIEQVLQQQTQRIHELENRIKMGMESHAQQVQVFLEQRLESEKVDYQAFLNENQTWRKEVVSQVNLQNRLPLMLWVIFLSLLMISLGINMAVLIKQDIWTTFMKTMLVIIMLILASCGVYLAYKQVTKDED